MSHNEKKGRHRLILTEYIKRNSSTYKTSFCDWIEEHGKPKTDRKLWRVMKEHCTYQKILVKTKKYPSSDIFFFSVTIYGLRPFIFDTFECGILSKLHVLLLFSIDSDFFHIHLGYMVKICLNHYLPSRLFLLSGQ